MKKTKIGFTLVELLIVLVIIGILTTLAIPQYTAYVWRGRYAEVFTMVDYIAKAEEAYRLEMGQYTPYGYTALQSMAGHADPTYNYDGSITQIQTDLGITIPKSCFFTYLIFHNEPPPSTQIYFKQPGCNWAWIYDCVSRKWINLIVMYDGGPAQKYFKPPS